MKTPKWLGMVPLFVAVWLMAMLASGWPGTVAHATESRPRWNVGGTVVPGLRDDDPDNDSVDEDGDNAESSNNNDNRGNVTIVPVSAPIATPVPAPAGQAVSSVDEVSQCLANGGVLVYNGPQATVAVKSFQDNLNVTLTRINPTSQPAPPGAIVGSYVFRMSASPCGGAPYTVLPREVNLAVSYSETIAAGRDESRFVLMRYDGTAWTTAPKLYTDPANNYISVSVTGLGVYALVQQ